MAESTTRRQALADRGGELLEEAAEISRTSMRTRFERLRSAWRSLIQVGLAAMVALLIAQEVLGHTRPFFAPVAAIITLGVTVGKRGRRAGELALGVAVGIAIADVVLVWIGRGPVQLAVVVMLAMAVAVFLGSGQILANQAAVSAVLVATISQAGTGLSTDRFIDALIGGGIGLLVHALVLPADPIKIVRREADPVLDELALTLERVAEAIEKRDRELAERALVRARGLDALEARFQEAVSVSRETARFAPSRRRARGQVDFYAQAAAQVDLAIRNVRVLARAAVRGVRLDENMPPEVAEAVRELAEAVRALQAALGDPARADAVRPHALRAAGGATLVLERTGNLSVTVVVAQVRSTAVDLLRGSGMSYDDALEAVRVAAQGVAAEEEEAADADGGPGELRG
jgi:uncharacterized membrane protein YgaE (UPF0421/DUF939 family)